MISQNISIYITFYEGFWTTNISINAAITNNAIANYASVLMAYLIYLIY